MAKVRQSGSVHKVPAVCYDFLFFLFLNPGTVGLFLLISQEQRKQRRTVEDHIP